MAQRVAVNVSLTPELSEFMRKQVRSGRFQSSSEVVREALRSMEERESLRSIAVRELRRQVKEGLADVAAGRLIDGTTAFAMLKESRKQWRKRAS
jgi:antitoxin ParD1/3/4